MPRLPENSVLVAHKAIGLAPGFTGDTRRVATAILDHFNHKSGRCDPSNERLAGLLGVSVRMVRKATKELCEGSSPLFRKRSHAGHSHCASYEPQWATFRRIVAEWNRAMIGSKEGGPNRNKRAGSTGTNVPVQQEQMCLQTRRRNQTKEPRETVALSAGRDAETGNAVKFGGRNGLGKEGAKPQSQRFLVHAIAGGKQPSRQDAAEAARWRKVSAEIEKLPKHEREAAWLAVGDGK